MTNRRVLNHPVLPISERKTIRFSFAGKPLECYVDEVISTALIANGIHIFGHHPKDGSSQGIFCANGQCSQCTVIADGKSVKGCMVKVEPGMVIEPLEGLPELPSEIKTTSEEQIHQIKDIEVDVLILGGGPSGLSAARTLSDAGVEKIILVDDKDHLGAKTCASLMYRLFREENVPFDEVTGGTTRPLFVEVPLGILAGIETKKEEETDQ